MEGSILHQSFMDPFRKDRGRIAEGSFFMKDRFFDGGSMKDLFFYEESIFYERSMKDRFLWRIDEGSFFMKDRWRISDLWSFIKKSTFIDPSWKDRWRIKKSILHQSFMDPFRKDRGRIAEGSFLWRIVFLMEDRWRIVFLWRIDFLWKIDEGSFFMKDRWRIVFYEGSMKDLGSMILHKKIDLHRSFMHPSWKDRWRIKKSILHQSFMDPFRKDRGRIAEGSFFMKDRFFWWGIDEGS